jgi:hypothetical protein
VELISASLDGDEPSITTAWVAGGSIDAALARATPTPLLVGVVADAAMTISELHDRGIVHGRIDATHILIAERGAVITGLAEASTDGEPADDVLALGRLLEVITAGQEASAPSRHRRDHDDDRIRHAITRATEPDAALRCPARVLARLLTEEVAPHSASERSRMVAPRARALPPLRARARALTAVVVAAALSVIIAITAATIFGSSDGGATVETVHSSTSTTATASTTTGPTTTIRPAASSIAASPTWPVPPPGCAQTATPYADVDGDGCPDEIAIEAGAINVAGHHFVMSVDPADVVAIGDWDCDGIATPAVLRVPSGAIDVVDHWPTNDEPNITARRITVIEGAASAEARPRAEPGCATLAVGTPAGVQEVTW